MTACVFVCIANSGSPTHTTRRPPSSSLHRTWSLWEHEIPAEKLAGKAAIEVVVKATDTSYNVQPERIEPYWNLVRACLSVCLGCAGVRASERVFCVAVWVGRCAAALLCTSTRSPHPHTQHNVCTSHV